MATMDNHEDKVREYHIRDDASTEIMRNVLSLQVWALAVSGDGDTVVTAAADSVITFWTDSTDVEQREKDEKREELVTK